MLEKIKEKWDDILLKIKEDHDITDVSYKTWLLPLKPYSVDKDILTILVPNEIFFGICGKKIRICVDLYHRGIDRRTLFPGF